MSPSLSIDTLFSKISDPREQDQLLYPLPGLLKLVVLGKMCGRVTLISSWRMGRRLPCNVLQRLGFKSGKAPCLSTLTETLKQVDPSSVRLVFATAVRSLSLVEEEEVAIDGKCLRGSRDSDFPAMKLLAAFCHRLQGVIGEVKVGDDTNEITAMLDLLDSVDLSGMIITGDAAFAQTRICNKVIEKKADYVFTVKENQPTLKKHIESAARAAEAAFSP